MSTLKVNNVQDLGADNVVVNGVVDKLALPSGSILQVVSTTKTDTFSTSSTSFTDVTGLSASITPGSASNKILVSVKLTGGTSPLTNTSHLRLMRDSTPIAIGDAANNRDQVSFTIIPVSSNQLVFGGAEILDVPNTTSSITYNVEVRATTANAVYVNRSYTDTDNVVFARSVSSITLMEVAG